MISLYDILEAADGQLFGEPAAHLFTDFYFDPEQSGESKLFVAMASHQADAQQAMEAAIEHGASGILCVEPPVADARGVSVLMVNDPLSALLAWSQRVLERCQTRVIAVAGSSDRSVTAEAITQVLRLRYRVHCSGDTDGRLSVPLAVAHLKPEHDFLVMRLSPAGPGDMAAMAEAVRPRLGVCAHLDCLQTPGFDHCDAYLEEQAVLMHQLAPGGLALLNFDEDAARDLSSRTSARVFTVGIDRFGADLMAFNVVTGLTSTGFDLRHGAQRYVGRSVSLLGPHKLYAALAAAATGLEFDIPVDESLRALAELRPLPGRMNPLIGRANCLLVDDSYRARPSSTLAALDWLEAVSTQQQRRIFVLGDLDDLNTQARNASRLIGQRAAQVATHMITIGSESALIGLSAIEQGMDPAQVWSTYAAEDAVDIISSLIPGRDDIILFKGGAAAGMERIVREFLLDPGDAGHLARQDRLPARSRPPQRSLRPSWLEIDSAALASNVRLIRAMLPDNVTLMATVKADGYGHGAVMAAQTALLNGASHLAVASFLEAMALRDAGVDAPILVLTYAPDHAVRRAVQRNITLTCFDLEQARAYDRAAEAAGGKLRVHVKVDTGMGRLGMFPDEAMPFFRQVASFEHIEIEGIYTHFSSADDDSDYTNEQIRRFKQVVRPLQAGGFSFRYVHAANSPGVLLVDDADLNLVRPGLLLYGLSPTDHWPVPGELRPVMSWKTSVLQLKRFPPGSPIGYGRTYHTTGEEIIAILPVGYADGLRRAPSTWREVLVKGQRAPLVGRVSMEKCAINVSHIPDVHPGDEVVLLGRQGDDHISAEEVAEWLSTSNYEVVTTILPRVPRL